MSTIEKALERMAEASAKPPPPDDDDDRDEVAGSSASERDDANAVPSSAREAAALDLDLSPDSTDVDVAGSPVQSEAGGPDYPRHDQVVPFAADAEAPGPSTDDELGAVSDDEPLPQSVEAAPDVPSISLEALGGADVIAEPEVPVVPLASVSSLDVADGVAADHPEAELPPEATSAGAEIPELDSLPSLAPGALGAGSEIETAPRGASRRVSAEVTVDLGLMRSAGLLTPEAHNSQLAEQLRHIKRPLLMAASDTERAPNANLIMLASALPNEGKTSTAVNLAVSIAMERDRTVLLIDADVVKSDVSNMLGISAKIGLTDLLFDPQLSVPDVMLRTSVPKLSVIPAGQQIPNVTELFAGEDMRSLMLDLSQRYPDRIVVIDSPPLLATTGASVLGSLVGQIVLVVEAVRTPQHAVAEALRMLGPLDNIGIVLNKARHRPTYYSTYGYGYDYYSSPT